MILYSLEPGPTLAGWLEDKTYDRIFVLCDSQTSENCFSFINNYLNAPQLIVIPSGEKNKNTESAELVWRELVQHNATRHSLLINLGGGMVTDLGGFCASVYQRGIDFIHIPTSLMAMVDASVGGKTGIDFQDYKNYIGTFTNPELILISPLFLKTLPHEEIINGWAEVLKHAIISGGDDLGLANQIPHYQQTETWLEIIQRNVEIKSEIVEADPNEKNERKKLNFGHTAGHAIESLFLSRGEPLSHGFCVAAGYISNL